ncbi:hypothetical protein [Pseudomonas californiensis]|uniref:hypothetical protein n=1 Tax=Pseudomonas californiensis TaxID=2829823 RepID=UPI001E579E16|nr:hypothetical protein [Pseudomonas californiensis]
MAISLNPVNIPSLVNRLTPSDQILTAQPMSDTAKQALLNATPAAVYHPSDKAPSTSLSMDEVYTLIGRSQTPEFLNRVSVHSSAKAQLKNSFEAFQTSLAKLAPDLASKKFGFTVEENGNLKALNSAGQLSTSDEERLNKLLNDDNSLKASAVGYRDSSIDLVAADTGWSGSSMGRYSLTKENFAGTLDLAALLIPVTKTPSQEQYDGMFFVQLTKKGQPATAATEEIIMSARAAKQTAASAG